MAKHGICPTSKKRNYGKGRKKKQTVITKRFMGCMWWDDSGEVSYLARNNRTRNQGSFRGLTAPSRKRVKGNRRRARRNMRSSVSSAQSDVKAEKEAKHAALEKKKKFHAKKTRQMRIRFLRDIHELKGKTRQMQKCFLCDMHELKEKHRLELLALKEDRI